MSKCSILNITKNLYVNQPNPYAPVTLVPAQDRTIFCDEYEADDLRAELDETEDDCYTVIIEECFIFMEE